MKNWLKIFFLFSALGLLVYANGLNNKFLIDDYTCLGNPVLSQTRFILSQWNPYREQSLGVLESNDIFGYYRPMAHMVSNFEYATFKNNYWQYHLLNILIYVFASSLVYVFVVTLSGNNFLALLAGLFYLIHPVNQIAVDYILGNAFALEVIFMLGTILLLWNSLERKNDRKFYFLSILFSFFSLFWHESGIMTPFYISAVVLFLRKGPLKEKVFYLLPFFFVSFSYLIFRLNFLGINEPILEKMGSYHMNGWQYLGGMFQAYSWYITRLFYPQGIVMAWATPILHEHFILNVLGAFLLIGLFLLLYIKFSKEKICQLGLAWLLIGFVPVFLAAFRLPENGVQIEPQWFVFSSIGFFILAAWSCLFVFDRTKRIGAILLFIVVFVWGSFSYTDTQLWADQKTYALYSLQQVPQLRSAYFYIADADQMQGDPKEAEKYYKMAISGQSFDNLSVSTYNNLGIMEASHSYKDAELYFEMALKIKPYSAETYNNLASLYNSEGLLDKAKADFERALLLNPLLLAPRIGLAGISLRHGEYQKAIHLCLKNLEIVDDDPKTLLTLISIFIGQKDFVSLKKYTGRFVDSQTDPRLLAMLGGYLARNNAPQLAQDCFTKAKSLVPLK